MKLVIDASVAVKWTIKEEGHDEAIGLISAGHQLLAPDFVLMELGSVLWKKVRLGEITADQALVAADEARSALNDILPTADFIDRALRLALELDHPIYDCLYLAVAEASQAKVVTADKRLLTRFSAAQYAGLVTDLADFRMS